MLPDGFLNPFVGRKRSTTAVTPDRIEDLKITVDMATELIAQCDSFQLPFSLLLTLFGLRPGELGWVFGEEAAQPVVPGQV